MAEFIDHADAILAGTIVAVEGGILHDNHAGFMLEVAVANVLKQGIDFQESTVFAFYPAGDVHIGANVVCRLNSQLPGTPRVGDRVLLGPRRAPISSDPTVISLLGTGVEILVRADSRFFIPKGLSAVPEFTESADFEALVRQTERLSKQVRQRR